MSYIKSDTYIDINYNPNDIHIYDFKIKELEADRIIFCLYRNNGDILECEINNKLNLNIDIMKVKKELEEGYKKIKILRKSSKSVMKIDSENNEYHLHITGKTEPYIILMRGYSCEMSKKEMEKYIEKIHETIKSKGHYTFESNISSNLEKSIKHAYKEKYGTELKNSVIKLLIFLEKKQQKY